MSTNTWNRYGPQPTSGQEDPFVSARFAPAVLESVQTPRLGSYLVDKSIGWDAINVPLVTALPVRPKDQTIVRFVADDDNGVIWTLMYWAGAPSASRWHYLGGPPLLSEVDTEETTTSTSYTDLATTGPSFTLPVKGTYDISGGAYLNNNTDARGARMSFAGSAAASDNEQFAYLFQTGATIVSSMARTQRVLFTDAPTVTAKYKALVGGTALFGMRWISATPVRIG